MATFALCWFASPSSAVPYQHLNHSGISPQGKVFGIMEDNPNVSLVKKAGFGYLKRTVWLENQNWSFTALNEKYREMLDVGLKEAESQGVPVILQLYQRGTPPKGSTQHREVCKLAKDMVQKYPGISAIEVGVEPNSLQFWRPQFVDGANVSALAYFGWLSACYDQLKGFKPELIIIGGGLASRGKDSQENRGADVSTSPTLFLQKLCEVYRKSGRTRPIMDWFDMHSYQMEEPRTQHPNSSTITIGDYEKLDKLLGCFEFPGSAQPKPPILWGESGYDSQIPKGEVFRYVGEQPANIPGIDEETLGRYYAESIRMAYCQPNSKGFFIFHTVDEPDLRGWQSGLWYAVDRSDRTLSGRTYSVKAKRSLALVREAMDAVNSGSIKCG